MIISRIKRTADRSRRLSNTPAKWKHLIRLRCSGIHADGPGCGHETGRFFASGYVDKGGEVYHAPIKGHEHVGLGGTEVLVYPEGVIGRPTLADAEKAKPGLEVLMDFMCRLINDIMTRFPAGQLPPVNKVTQRDPEEIEALLKGPLNGGKHLYTVAYPP